MNEADARKLRQIMFPKPKWIRAGETLFQPWTGPSLDAYYPEGIMETTLVEVMFANGQLHTGVAQAFCWTTHSGYPQEVKIVAYRTKIK